MSSAQSVILSIMKKQYELIQNGICLDWFEKNTQGLEQAYQQAYQVLSDYEGVDSGEVIEELEIQYVTYDACGKVVECELVHEFNPSEANLGNWEAGINS